jgi:hypothetical protein
MNCIAALLAAILASLGEACSPYDGWRPLTPAEKFQHANVVFYGKIIHTYKDDTWPTAYTAEMDVYCTLKGEQTAKKVNLTEAGFVEGLCHSSNLTVGSKYIVVVRNDNNRYAVSEKEIDVTEENVMNISAACGLRPTYPKGVNANTVKPERVCIVSTSTDNCPPKEIPKLGPSVDEEYNAYGEKAEDIVEKKNPTDDNSGSATKTVTSSIVTITLAVLINHR